ncbi:MAG TPA: beta-ketoacyl-[acyl-carrier-protein] synthase family protein [Burkholderiaceae bacterium]
MPQPIYLTAFTTTSALGAGVGATVAALRSGLSGLRQNDFRDAPLATWIGRVDGVEQEQLPAKLLAYTCRNNQLAQLGLRQDGFMEAVARARVAYGAHRVAVILGTSTSGIFETELAFRVRRHAGAWPADVRYRERHSLFSLTDFVRRRLALEGPGHIISTACSSSAKVFASAARFLRQGLCDAVVVGGVDSLSLTTLYGFSSLELVSPEPCRPWDAARKGISIGEAAGFALLERSGNSEIVLSGYGESSDAYHMSTPHPQGAGAAQAMRAALRSAGLQAAQIDYVNLHGTGTPSNDAAEDLAVLDVLGSDVACSSTKGATGHTLGAAGITEAVISALCLHHGLIPGGGTAIEIDPQLHANYVRESRSANPRHILSNSFGFGGSNCSLLFSRADA